LPGLPSAADYAHAMLGMTPTRTSSAVATGAIFAAIQRFRGDDALVINFVGGAANDAFVRYAGKRRLLK